MLEATRPNGKNHCQLLRAAAEAIRICGRAIGTRQDPLYRRSGAKVGPMCALGALDYAAGSDPSNCRIDTDPIIKVIQTRLKLDSLKGPTYAIANWSNNAPDDETVIKGFLQVATELEAEGLCFSDKV